MIGKEEKILLLALTALSLAVSVATISCTGTAGYLHTISTGFLLSAIFFFLVVYLPDQKRREIVARNFVQQYDQIKLSLIGTFLILSDSQQYGNRENLLIREEFKRYFKGANEKGEDRWSAIANGLQGNEYYLREVVFELRMLNDEIRFFRNTLPIQESEVFEFLNRLSQAISKVELTQPDYDEVKNFCRFLWQLFTGYNFIDGYSKSSYIDDMIRRAK